MNPIHIRTIFVLFVFTLFFFPKINATHIVGGDLSYECLGNNEYRFTMRVYRDCYLGQAGFDDPAVMRIFTGPNGNILFGDTLAIENPIVSNIPPVVSNPCLMPPSNVCVEQGVYRRVVTLPFNANGYHISYQRCCRNNTISNIAFPQGAGATYTVFISGESQQTCNNSPTFNDFPPIVICAGQDIDFDNSATDAEGDQLVYSFCAPFLGGSQDNPTPNAAPPPYNQVNFINPFTASNPLGGMPAVTIDANSGLISGVPTAQGQYVVGICVDEYRVVNGVQVLLGTTKRDFQFNVVDCEQTLVAAIASEIVIDIDEYIVNECADPTVNFVNQSYPNALIDSYFWNIDLGNGDVFTSTAVNPTHTFPGVGTYNGILVVNPGNTICTDTAEIIVVIHPDITADFEVTFDPCSLDPIQFTDQTIAEAGGVIYDWNFGDGTSSDGQNPSHQYAPGNYTVTLNVEDVNGCTDQLSQDISYFPTPNMGFDVSDAIGCGGHTVTFTNTSAPLTGDYTIDWNLGDGTMSSDISPTHTYDTPGSYDVTLTITSPTGCTGTETFSSIDIQSGPLIGFTFSDPCIVGSITFTNTTTPGQSPITNTTWSFGDGNTSSELSPVHDYGTPGSYDVVLVVSDAEGCTTNLEQTVNYFPPSIINTSPSVTEGCEPLTVTFSNNSSPLTSDYTVTWDFGDGNMSNEVSPTYTYDTPGTYTVMISISPPGAECTTEEIYTDLILVRATPEVDFTFSDLCTFGAISFTGNITPGDGAITSIQWDFGDGNTATEQSPSHEYATPGTYTVTLVIMDEFGCVDSFSETIDYFPASIINVDFEPEGCTPHSAIFENNAMPLTADYTVEWDFGDGNTSVQVSPTHLYDIPGTYTITLTMTSPSNCVTQEIFTDAIFVQRGPIAAFDFSDPCALGPITFTNTTTPGDGNITSVEWDFGDGNTSSEANPVHEFTTPGTYTVSLTIIDEFDCNNSITQDISYFPSPVIDIVFDEEGCTPHTVTFQNNSTPITPAFTFEWGFGDGGTSTSLSPTHTYTMPGTYDVGLTMTSPSGCAITFVIPDAVFVQVGANTAFTYAFDSCAYEPAQYFDQSTSGDANITGWNWDFGDGNTSVEQNPTHPFDDPGSYPVTLTVADENGCEISATQTIDWFPTPFIEVDLDTDEGCQELTVSFENNTFPLAGYTTEWDFGDGNTGTDQEPVHTYLYAGTYDVSLVVTSPIGCQKSELFPALIRVDSVPAVDFFPNEGTCLDGPVNFQDLTPPNGGNIISWAWDFGDGATSTEQNPIHEYAVSGTYDVTLSVVAENGCSSTVIHSINWEYIPGVAFDVDNPQGCQPHTVEFMNEADSIAGWVLNWEFGDGGTGTGLDPVYTYQNTGTYDVVLTLTSPFGCVIETLYPAYIQVDTLPVAAFDFDYSCENVAVSFQDLSIPTGAAITSWDWDFGDGESSNEQNPEHIFPPVAALYTVTLTVTDANGCMDATSQQIDWFPPALIDFEADDNYGCAPHIVNFINNTMPTDTGYELLWDLGNGETSTELEPTNINYDIGTYTVSLQVTAPTGCVTNLTLTDYIQVTNPPIADFTFSPDNPTNLNPEVSFTETSQYDTEWLWNFGNGDESNQPNPIYTYPDTGYYNITLYVSQLSGCTDSITKVIDIAPVHTYHLPNAFTPNYDNKNDGFKGKGITWTLRDFDMSIFNRWGELIFQTNDPDEAWNGRKNNSGQPSPNGVYIYLVTLTDGRGEAFEYKGYATLVR